MTRAFLVAVGLASALGNAVALAQTPAPSSESPGGPTMDTALTDTERTDLISLREEEKLARDVYRTLLARWGIPAFRNIAEAEQRHMDRIGALLRERGIPDPVLDDAIGRFTSPRFAALYGELTERGLRSSRDALQVGALIEELDIFDIDQMLARTRDASAREAYASLQCGSRNHLRAFTRLLRGSGVTYAPQHLTPAAYQSILSSAHERCGPGGRGPGGRGPGGRGPGGRGRGGAGRGPR